MTIYKTLKEQTVNGKTITAYEYTDKYESRPKYCVVVSRDGLGYLNIKTARTTWAKKFNEIVNETR